MSRCDVFGVKNAGQIFYAMLKQVAIPCKSLFTLFFSFKSIIQKCLFLTLKTLYRALSLIINSITRSFNTAVKINTNLPSY